MDNKKTYKCCFTGYRPGKFPFSLDGADGEYLKFENRLCECLLELHSKGCREFLCGMAMGFDIIAAETVIFMKQNVDSDIKLYCVLPFENQSDTFPDVWKKRHAACLENAYRTEIICDAFTKSCYRKRNIYMVDNSDFVVTWFDGKPGGTKNTLNYAAKKQRRIINLNDDPLYQNPEQLMFEVIY